MEHVFAQTSTTVDIGSAFAPAKTFGTIGGLVSVIVKNAFMVAGVLALVLLVIGGFGMITGAGGDSKGLEKGKQAVTGAVLGLVVIIGSYWIIQLVEYLTGISILSPK
jgi:hypothetical protein